MLNSTILRSTSCLKTASKSSNVNIIRNITSKRKPAPELPQRVNRKITPFGYLLLVGF